MSLRMINLLKLKDIKFPVYRIPDYKTFNIVHKPNGKIVVKIGESELVLDNISFKGDLGLRRLKQKSTFPKEKLVKLSKRFTDILQLRKQPSNYLFIDSNGIIFSYTKSINCIIKTHKIERHTFIESKNLFRIKVKGISSAYFVSSKDWDYQKFARIIYTPFGPLLYKLAHEYKKPYKRKI